VLYLDKTLEISSILPDSLVNGEGMRSVLFLTGCSHNCPGCHNKELNKMPGSMYTIEQAKAYIDRNTFDKKVTFSGGDPMMQSKSLVDLCELLHDDGYNIWVYTGYTYEEVTANYDMSMVLLYIDVLVDGKFDIELHDSNLKFRGSSNQRIIDVQQTLESETIVLHEIS
jgi:anaerobic ribonucleoside-triphosphate reductase activating protein